MTARSLPVLVGMLAGAATTGIAYRALRSRPPGPRDRTDRWSRTNHRSETVTLLEGPAYALGATVGAAATPGLSIRMRLAGSVAALGAGVFGGYDDHAGSGGSRGFSGHVGALRRGEVTSGMVKLLGIGATGIIAAVLLPPRTRGVARIGETLVSGAVVAATANLLNLFDLRPGRAIKVGLLTGAPLMIAGGSGARAAAAPLGAAAVVLPADLGERAMLGDCGANALGSALGVAWAARLGMRGRCAVLVAVVALTAASEKVSFTKVIHSVGPLRWMDELGRRPSLEGTPAQPRTAAAQPSVR